MYGENFLHTHPVLRLVRLFSAKLLPSGLLLEDRPRGPRALLSWSAREAPSRTQLAFSDNY